MKRQLIIGLTIILFVGIISATPYILFVNPTPSSEYEIIKNNVFYDLGFDVEDISSSRSNKLMFKEIHKEIFSTGQKEVWEK